jgi:hypothetical protein
LSEQSIGTGGALSSDQGEAQRLALIRNRVVEAFRTYPDNQNDQSGDFTPNDNWFLRIAHTVFQTIAFRDREEFCNTCHRVSLKKIDFDVLTYSAEEYLLDVQKSLKGKIERIPSGTAIRSHFSGYPMKTSQQSGSVTHRIYINPQPRHAAAVYGHLLDMKPPMFLSKLSDHEILTTCRDTFVVYVSSLAAFTQILDILGSYQREHLDHFIDEIPVMTRPVDGLAGVGWAEDAPLYRDGGPILDYYSKRRESDQSWAQSHPWPMETPTIGLSHSEWRSVFVLSALRRSAGGDISALRTELRDIAAAAKLTPQTMFMTATIGTELLGLVEDELFPQVE